jgi:aminopeptidase
MFYTHDMDPRATRLAEVLVDHSVRVQPGDNVLIAASDPCSMDVLHECYRLCLERGANADIDIANVQVYLGRSDFGNILKTHLTNASPAQLSRVPDLAQSKIAWATKTIRVTSIQDPTFLAGVDPKLVTQWQHTVSPTMENLVSKDWVLSKFPTKSYAENAGMSLEEFTDYFYAACCIDYEALGARIKPLADRLDTGKRVRILGPGTDILLGIEGRLAAGTVSGRHNVPDGECFVGPEEHITEGHITFEESQIYDGNEVKGVYLRFERGEIVEARAEKGEEFLLMLLDDHPDNRRLGELGIGMNPNITRYSKNTLFDEKIAGTIHMAVGRSYKYERGGGKNGGSIHWDLVKDMRLPGTEVRIDDQIVMKDGKLTF